MSLIEEVTGWALEPSLGVPGEAKTRLSLPGIEPWLPNGPACILVRTPPGLSGSCWFRRT